MKIKVNIGINKNVATITHKRLGIQKSYTIQRGINVEKLTDALKAFDELIEATELVNTL